MLCHLPEHAFIGLRHDMRGGHHHEGMPSIAMAAEWIEIGNGYVYVPRCRIGSASRIAALTG